MYKEIAQKIIGILKADSTLGSKIKRWYFGEHDIRKPDTLFPFIDVKWCGGPVEKVKTGGTITRRTIEFTIRCVARHVDEDVAEKFVMDMSEQIESVLDANDTLSGLVETSEVTQVLSDNLPMAGYSIVGSQTRLRAKT